MIEFFRPESAKTVLMGVVGAGALLVWVARSLPHVAWLQPFRLEAFQPTAAQKARHSRFGTTKAAVEIMLAGMAVPMLYLLSKVFMFNEPTVTGMVVSGLIALAGITIGIVILVKGR